MPVGLVCSVAIVIMSASSYRFVMPTLMICLLLTYNTVQLPYVAVVQ